MRRLSVVSSFVFLLTQSAVLAECKVPTMKAKGPAGEPFIAGVVADSGRDANSEVCNYEYLRANGGRFWYSIYKWNGIGTDSKSSLGNLKKKLPAYKKAGIKTTLTITIAEDTNPMPANGTEAMNAMKTIANFLRDDSTKKSLIDNYQVINEIEHSPYWPKSTSKNYTRDMFFHMNKGLKSISFPDGQVVRIYAASTWCYAGDIRTRMLKDMINGLKSAGSDDRKYYVPDGFDCHEYNKNPDSILSDIAKARSGNESNVWSFDSFQSQVRTLASQYGIDSLRNYKYRLMASEWNCAGHNDSNSDLKETRACLKSVFNRPGASRDMRRLMDETYYYILHCNKTDRVRCFKNRLMKDGRDGNYLESDFRDGVSGLYDLSGAASDDSGSEPPTVPPSGGGQTVSGNLSAFKLFEIRRASDGKLLQTVKSGDTVSLAKIGTKSVTIVAVAALPTITSVRFKNSSINRCDAWGPLFSITSDNGSGGKTFSSITLAKGTYSVTLTAHTSGTCGGTGKTETLSLKVSS